MQKLYSAILFAVLITMQIPVIFAQETLAGDWKGAIDVQGTKLEIVTHFSSSGNGVKGTIDIPQQGGKDIPLQQITVTPDDSVHFEFMAGMGMAKFRGTFENDTAIAGTFHQSGRTFPFQLKKMSHKQDNESDKIRDNQKVTDYRTEDILIKNDTITIGGTLTWPEDKQTHRLLIMISGSGAQDRDETMTPVSDFKPFALLADSLTTNGIATFRFDDRGVGQSTGNFANTTLNMLALDVKTIIDSLKSHPSHQFTEIILLGHSQGGIVAGKVAAKYPSVDKLILMASTGIPLKKLLRFQVRQQFEQVGIDNVTIEKEISAREKLMEAIVNDGNVEKVKKEYREIFKNIQLSAGADSTQASNLAKQQANQLAETFRTPQLQSLLFYDPTDDLKNVDVPVLAVFGGKDTQVPVATNKKPIERALQSAGVDYQVKVFPDANHPFQKAKTGSVQEYATLENKFVNGFTSTIINWIKKNQ